MQISQTQRFMTAAALAALLSSVGIYTQGQQAQEPAQQPAPIPPIMQASPLLNAIDVNHDGRIDSTELADAPARLKTLDKNADGKITRDEGALPAGYGRPAGPGPGAGRAGEPGRGAGSGRAGEPPARGGDAGRAAGAAATGGDERRFEVPIPGPTADELLALLMSFDKNKDGKLSKAEVPERQQGLFERGDTDKNGVLDAAELKKVTADQAAAPPAPPRPPRGGFAAIDLASIALDADHNGEISAEEISNAATTLKTLDKNTDGFITEDEAKPAPAGRGRG
jgi:Ca2+-binding EF-hand superfamily protein